MRLLPLREQPLFKESSNMFKKFFISVLLLIATQVIASCGDDDKDPVTSSTKITVDPTELSFDGFAGSKELTISTDHEWAAVTEQDWITVDPKSSVIGNQTITVTVAKNGEFDPREGQITFMSGTARSYVTVKQAGGDGVPDPNAIVCPIKGYKLVWNDEFDQASTSLNSNDWRHEVQGSGWVNNELQNYVNEVSPDGKRVTEVKNGKLRIRCFKENGKIYSGRVYAKDKTGWQYGYMEAKIKLPKGKGTWPAFWMMPVHFTSWPADGEIDIMEEVGCNPNYVSSSLHATGHVHSNNTQVTHEMKCEGAEDDFHVYAMEWTAKNITTYVDGKVQLVYDNPGTGKVDWPYNAEFYIILNLAWGGSWGGMNGVDENALPATMEVEYVRVFQK